MALAAQPPRRRGLAFLLALSAAATSATAQPLAVALTFSPAGDHSVLVGGLPWLSSPVGAAPTVCVAGQANVALTFRGLVPAAGVDALGSWTGTTASFVTSDASAALITLTSQNYIARGGSVAVFMAAFPNGLDTSNCGSNTQQSTRLPFFDTGAAQAPTLGFISWRGTALGNTVAARGLAALDQAGLDAGPVVATNGASGASLVWSTLNHHKIIVQATASGKYTMGMSAAVPSIPANWSYSVLFSADAGGATAATYAWGTAIQAWSGTYRLPSVTLTDVGYYTDDGAYYYVWEAFGCCDPVHHNPRPWAAEDGLVLVKQDLWAKGVPVAYMQLDDWWYTGRFYFGNVKVVEDWHPSNATRLFPKGAGSLAAFQKALGIPLQLYTPFWSSDKFDILHKYNMTPSTAFAGTKLVTPDDSYRFFSDWFDLGAELTGSRASFVAYEIDFLDDNFRGSASMFESVYAADRWYAGMADAALERGVVVQYCLPSATDMLQSLVYPAVVQARASADYVNTVDNPYQLGGSSLLMGATLIAPSKDTLWTASPQPATYNDEIQDGTYTTQPHVQLDAVLATLSLGPVGISDGLGQVGVDLISQAFRSPTDSTLLRPARPLSWCDSYFYNKSFARGNSLDVRTTHSAVPLQRGGAAGAPSLYSHMVVAWRTGADATLGLSDLYPAPPAGVTVALRQHVVAPAGAAQQAGCVDGQPAAGACATFVTYGNIVVPATGTALAEFSLWHVHVALSNGAFFLGELAKFVHVAPARFDYVLIDAANGGKAGLVVGVRGSAGQSVVITAVDAGGVARVATVSLPTSGFADVAL